MRTIACRLFEELNARELRYCHWKSNWCLEDTLAAKTDLDVLVDRRDARPFRAILHGLGFRPAVEPGTPPFPSVEHYHALDEAMGVLVHLHAYYRIVSGGSLAKNYRLPIEDMLLENTRRVGLVTVPTKGAELIVFALRMSLKHANVSELALVVRDWAKVRREAAWLDSPGARAEAVALLRRWLPRLDPALFAASVEAIARPAPLARRIALARRVRTQLRPYARHGAAHAWLATSRSFAVRAARRARGRRSRLMPSSGGAVIAFVGSEASGKSTALEAVEQCLGAHYAVRRVHVGKPPSTPLTVVPNRFLPALRTLFPAQRTTRVGTNGSSANGRAGTNGAFPLLFGVRSVLLAHDRRAVLKRAFARASNGTVVLCDRYPSAEVGRPDGPQLGSGNGSVARGALARLESRLYRDIPRPDLVVYLTAPLDVTLERNRARTKVEEDDYVRARYARSTGLRFDGVPIEQVDTNRPLDASLEDVRRIVWDAL